MKASSLSHCSGRNRRYQFDRGRCLLRRHSRRLLMERLEDRRVLASWSGTLSGDTTWTSAEVQEITNDLRVANGVTLTVEPGTIVKFHHSNVHLFVDGTLDAQGTTSQNIIFTSLRDDMGGDTNGDGGASLPGPGNWAQIEVNGTATISHAQVRYGGHFYGSQIEVNGGDLTLADSTISHSESDGVRILDSDPMLDDNTFANNANAAISMNLNSNPTITGFTWSGNGINGLQLDAGALERNLTWDDPDIVYRPDGDITVPTGMVLTVNAGQIVKPAHANAHLFVDGALQITGTASDPVVFTSFADDTRGGDTNGDAGASTPGAANGPES